MGEKNYKSDVDALRSEFDFSKFKYELKFETTAGDIEIEFYPDVAPGHCFNMLGLAKLGFYNDIVFHRVVKDFVIQAGCPKGTGAGGPGYTIKAEFNKRLHEAGVLSMARTNDPDSGGSQFFLCLGKVPYLDGKYTVFGKTKNQPSLDNVLKIGKMSVDQSDRPQQDVIIKKAIITQHPL